MTHIKGDSYWNLKKFLLVHDIDSPLCLCLDMAFDDDVKLFGLFRRYSDPEEAEELEKQVVEYVRTQIHDVNAELTEFKTAN